MCPNGESEIPDVVAQTLLKLKVAKPRHVAREFGRGWGETERQRGGGRCVWAMKVKNLKRGLWTDMLPREILRSVDCLVQIQ